MKTFLKLFAALVLAATPLHAQLVADGATNTLSDVTNSIAGTLIVGTNGSFTLLVLSDNALLTNSVNGIIGRNSTAKSNEVRLTSSTSRWRMGGSLFVGSNGMSSRLVVSNGALLEDLNANIGTAPASGNNSALVTGPGSLWTNRGSVSMSPGIIGSSSSNQLVVSDSATLASGTATVGGLRNQLLITGPGSLWANQSDFNFAGAGNRLDLNGGAGLFCSNATISGLVSGDDNIISMTGTGTVWTNTGNLTMGFGGARAVLAAGNGASLFVAGRASLGANGGANFNSVSVADPGTSWTVGSDLYVGSIGSANLLAISNGAVVVSSNAFLGSLFGASGNSALVVGAGSVWSNRNLLFIGEGGTGNRLVVSNGASVVNGTAVVGSGGTSDNNLVSISGAGSLWRTVRSSPGGDLTALTLGDFSAGNQLVVSNGGAVQVIGGYFTVGNTNSAVSNSVTLTGTGTSLTVAPGLLLNPHMYVGKFGSYARLVVENGAMLKTYSASVGTFGTGSVAFVTGPGTLWTNSSVIFLGSIQDDQLVVSNGATVQTRSFTMQNILGADAVVSGPGSSMTVQETLAVGAGFDGNNHMVIDNGAVVKSGDCFIGTGYVSDDNAIVVSGVGSVFSNAFLIEIGTSNQFNRLVISNGATVFTGGASLGSQDKGRNNEALVTGASSVWSNSTLITVGGRGHDNRLIISGGAAVHSGGSGVIVGEIAAATNNRVLVDGTLRATNASATAALDVRRGTNVFNSGLIDVDQLALTHAGTNVVTNVFTGTYGSSSTISIPAGGPASPYPSTFGVINATGLITRVTVTLSNLSHAHPADLDILLVGPAGQKVMLMSDAGGTNAITNVRLTFQDGTNFLASVGPITNGTYRPTDYIANENLPAPAPARPYSTDLFSFNGYSPNGLWKLYVSDAFNPDSGSLVGWGLRIETAESVVLDRGAFEFNGGTLITRGAVISNGLPFVVGTSGSTPAVWDVRAGASNTYVAGDVTIGRSASFNHLILTNGALLTNSGYGYLGQFATTSNSATLAGTGSRWLLQDDLIVGGSGVGHSLGLSDGALVGCSSAAIGNGSGSSNNLAVVTGNGSAWMIRHDLFVGNLGPANTLIVSNNAVVSINDAVYVGFDANATNNRLTVDGGTLRLTNATATGLLEVRRGSNVLNAGLIEADIVRLTNAPHGVLQFNGGILSARSSTISSGTILRLGNGFSPATMFLAGNGVHNFGGNLFTSISSNAVLTGNGTLLGAITISSGAKFIPGLPQGGIGKMVFSNSPALQGAIIMEISKSGATLTNDQVQVSGTLTHGGTLTVTNIGIDTLMAGDRFQLFVATNFAGSFASLHLPPLAPGLTWKTNLLVDGSLEVTFLPRAPQITSVTFNPTNGFPTILGIGEANQTYGIEVATNLNPPIVWQRIANSMADGSGSFQFTDTNAPSFPVRFYRALFP